MTLEQQLKLAEKTADDYWNELVWLEENDPENQADYNVAEQAYWKWEETRTELAQKWEKLAK